MRLHRMICLAGLLMFSAIGCCHSHCCVSSDPCDPCGQGMCGGGGGCGCHSGCGLGNWVHRKMAERKMRRCHNYSWFEGDCCPACGGDSCGYGAADGMTHTAGCGCGQTSGYAPSSMPASSVPGDPPAPSVPTPSVPNGSKTNEPNPAPASTDSASFQQPTGQVQHVSVEEFHRLPGTVIAGPTASSVPTLAAPAPATPALSSAPRPLINPVQQAQWAPTK